MPPASPGPSLAPASRQTPIPTVPLHPASACLFLLLESVAVASSPFASIRPHGSCCACTPRSSPARWFGGCYHPVVCSQPAGSFPGCSGCGWEFCCPVWGPCHSCNCPGGLRCSPSACVLSGKQLPNSCVSFGTRNVPGVGFFPLCPPSPSPFPPRGFPRSFRSNQSCFTPWEKLLRLL